MKKMQKPMCVVFCLAASAAAMILPSSVRATETQADLQGDAARGREMFVDYTCYACHGYTGETGSGARLNPPRLNQAGFIAYVRNPPNPDRMPPYRQQEVTDQNLADIFAFITSLKSNSPEVEDIPLLEAIIDEVSAVD